MVICKYCGQRLGGHINCKTAYFRGHKNTLDDLHVLHGKSAEHFLKQMNDTETRKPTKTELEIIKMIKNMPNNLKIK